MFPFGCAEMSLKVGERGLSFIQSKNSLYRAQDFPSGASEGLGLWCWW